MALMGKPGRTPPIYVDIREREHTPGIVDIRVCPVVAGDTGDAIAEFSLSLDGVRELANQLTAFHMDRLE